MDVPRYAVPGDPADPSVVAEHGKKVDEGPFSAGLFVERHKRSARLSAMLLEKERPYVVFPRRMPSREEEPVEKRNDEPYAAYRRFREDGMRRGKAIETAAERRGYGRSRGYEIVGLRASASEAGAR